MTVILISVAQSYWWEVLAFVAFRRISSADWLSPAPGTISGTTTNTYHWHGYWYWFWYSMSIGPLPDTFWNTHIFTFAVTSQWWATMLGWTTLDLGCYYSRSRFAGWLVTQSWFLNTYLTHPDQFLCGWEQGVWATVFEGRVGGRAHPSGETRIKLQRQNFRLIVPGYIGWAGEGRGGWSSSILHAHWIWHPGPWGGSDNNITNQLLSQGGSPIKYAHDGSIIIHSKPRWPIVFFLVNWSSAFIVYCINTEGGEGVQWEKLHHGGGNHWRFCPGEGLESWQGRQPGVQDDCQQLQPAHGQGS